MAISVFTASAAALLLLLPVAVLADDCTCYQTSVNDYFTQYVFHDFRSRTDFPSDIPPLPYRLPDDLDPASITGLPEGVGNTQDGFISSKDWIDDWNIVNWGKKPTSDFPVRMQNSAANIYMEKSTSDDIQSKLILRTHRFPDFQTAAEVESTQKNVFYCSVRIRARVKGGAGAVAGLFVYQDDQNESDIEILTRDQTDEIRYSNQPVVNKQGNEIKDSSTLVDFTDGRKIDGTQLTDKRKRDALARDSGDSTWLNKRADSIKWDEWHDHRIDWVKGKSSWFVDGKHYLDKTYGVPTVPSYFVMNLWSDGGVWSGNMTEGDSASIEIQWIEMAFNTSGPVKGRKDPNESRSLETLSKRKTSDEKCKTVCHVDDVKTVGVPEGGSVATPKKALGTRSVPTWQLLAGGMAVGIAGIWI